MNKFFLKHIISFPLTQLSNKRYLYDSSISGKWQKKQICNSRIVTTTPSSSREKGKGQQGKRIYG